MFKATVPYEPYFYISCRVSTYYTTILRADPRAVPNEQSKNGWSSVLRESSFVSSGRRSGISAYPITSWPLLLSSSSSSFTIPPTSRQYEGSSPH